MSKLAHSNDETMSIIEQRAREDEERGLRGEPPCPSCTGRVLPIRLHRINPHAPEGAAPLYVCDDCRQ